MPITYSRSVCYGKGKFIAIAENGNTAHSADGINWTPGEPLSPDPSVRWQSICYGDDKFVAVGYASGDGNRSAIVYSTDGDKWVDESTSSLPVGLKSVTYGLDSDIFGFL